ncbi:hypothetical protein FSP39_014364 [Pinctada imbricata]|uniref:Beta-1,4-glucuronyltransferase 1 n=1 Tax=Pinctada imbricata TaxID=66713 RepID=A0AA88XL71_PINIB|nr:hypothetical protein FSP39_014364 [Pinctada imbricata]
MRTEDGEISFIRRKDVFKSEYSGKVKREGPKRQGFITMVSHCSIENLHFVDTLAASWDGPISIAVFIDRNEVEFMRLVEYYHQCFKHIRAKTTFHLMYPESMALCFTKINCDAFGAKLKESPMYMRPLKGMSYPHNSLRNLATPTNGNGYVFHIDIDMIPSFNLHEEFLKYAETLDNRILESSIFIVPAFEYKHHTDDIPRTKLELMQRSVNREIRTFYSKACWKCQFNTNYRKWKYLKTKTMTTYDIESKFYNYEPYYIVRADRFIPYDERFLGRGYDRISQVLS